MKNNPKEYRSVSPVKSVGVVARETARWLCTGVILAKLDGTAKGGVVFAIVDELEIPVLFVGTGEKVGDLSEFDAEAFVKALFKN